MISYIEGAVINHDDRSVTVKAGPIGWRVFLGENTLANVLKDKESVALHTYLYSRDTAQELYGFTTAEELEFFELLLDVSGVGPRSAQLVLDSISLDELVGAIREEKSEVLMRISGIGTKTAKKIIIDLFPKVEKMQLEGMVDLDALAEEDDAIEALRSLGYTQREAKEALKKVPKDIEGISKRVEEALKLLGKKR